MGLLFLKMCLFWFSVTCPLEENEEGGADQASSQVSQVLKVTWAAKVSGTWLCFL